MYENNCPALSDLTTMTEDLWSHALKFLDKYRLDDEDGDYNCDNVDDYDDVYMERKKSNCNAVQLWWCVPGQMHSVW